ncbi:MAG TPA: hypothetical protein VGC70_07740 [Burkholderiales bacterium]
MRLVASADVHITRLCSITTCDRGRAEITTSGCRSGLETAGDNTFKFRREGNACTGCEWRVFQAGVLERSTRLA